MNKILIIYNPNAGRKTLSKKIPKLQELMLIRYGIAIDIAATSLEVHAKDIACDAANNGYETIIAAGGDGTVNEVLNGIMKSEKAVKMGIYPSGTVNDFGNYLRIPKNIYHFAALLNRGNSRRIDVGLGGDRYFLNVAAAGLLTDVAYKVSHEAKTVMGKFAYYIEGLKELPKQFFRPFRVELQYNGIKEEREILFFLLANSSHVGGFKNLVPDASLNDGRFDLLLVEKSQLIEAAGIFVLSLTGEHLNHPNLKYMQVEEVHIKGEGNPRVDIDGELGGQLPMSFKVVKGGIELLVP